jgi:hypothetical protein
MKDFDWNVMKYAHLDKFEHWHNKSPVLDEDGKDMTHPLYGKTHTAASKRRMAKARIGKSSWNKGIKASEESKQKMRDSTNHDGKDNPNWRGGVSGKPGSAKRKAYMKIYNKKYHEARRAA